ncbi:hypothetical protein HHK36_021324 [Tetracentron sinense]|uniref:Uncharacterized protein n=1 Tax=Tetracentron sinense TaxID=13715 RepID=A0A834YUT2_TETSI|nr:hypothetical protein HHK36_021324 [Tetracentron sinense]
MPLVSSIYVNLSDVRAYTAEPIKCTVEFSKLTISDPTILSHDTGSALLCKFHHLKRIDLLELHGDLDRLVREITRTGLNLEALNLSNQRRVHVEGLKDMGAKMKSLRILICSRLSFLQNSDLIVIADSFPLLEEVDFSYPEQDYGSLSELDSINGFTNSGPFRVTDAGIAVLSLKLRGLIKCLEAADFLTDQNMIDLSQYLHNLTSINLNSCSTLKNPTFFTLTKNCPSLEEIQMERTGLGKEDPPTVLEKNPQIRSLKLAWNKCLNDETLKKLRFVCPKIGELEVNGCLELRTIWTSSDHSELEVLRAGSGINNEGLSMIGQSCRALQHLDLKSCLGVTTRGVKEVVGSCKGLREVKELLQCEY